MGLGVRGWGEREGRRGKKEERDRQGAECVWSSLGHQPQLPPLPPPPLFSKIALSAPPAKRGSQARRTNSGSRKQSRHRHLQEREKAKKRPDRTHVYACPPAPRASSSLPRCPRQVEGWGRSGQAGV